MMVASSSCQTQLTGSDFCARWIGLNLCTGRNIASYIPCGVFFTSAHQLWFLHILMFALTMFWVARDDLPISDTRDGGLSLASFRYAPNISMPTTTAESLCVKTVVTFETRQYLENGMKRMLRSRQEISEMKERLEIIPYMDRTLASNRGVICNLCAPS